MDRDRLRAIADTRPGYATYPKTEQGSPSWWRRPLPGQQLVTEAVDAIPAPVATPPAPPPPPAGVPAAVVEQHTWTTDDVERVCKALGTPIQPWQSLLLRQLFAEPPSSARLHERHAHITLTPAPRRRWWHRFTRRRAAR